MKRHTLARRTFLRGCGIAMSLPCLKLCGQTWADQSTAKRAAFFYIPNGVVQDRWGADGDDSEFKLSPTLSPLQDLKNYISVYSNLDRVKVAGTDGHAQASTCWLSSAHPTELSPAGYPLKRTVDQLIADQTAAHTPFRSLELSCNPYTDNKESVYFDNISWYGHGHVAKSMRDPDKVFRRLFVVDENKVSASILDLVMEDAKAYSDSWVDRSRKLDEYLESVRAVEKQIKRIEDRKGTIEQLQVWRPLPFRGPSSNAMNIFD